MQRKLDRRAQHKSAKAAKEIQAFVRKLNEAWLKSRFDELSAYFHENAVIAPLVGKPVRGRGECVKTYREFMTTSKIRKYKESKVETHLFGRIAVATYRFDIDYRTSGKRYHDYGWEMFVLVRQRAKWLVAWRTVLPVDRESLHDLRALIRLSR